MDGQRLDGFARRFAMSRRGALKVLAAGAVGSVFGGLGTTDVLAAKNTKACKEFCNSAAIGKKFKQKCKHQCARGGTTGYFAECEGNLANLCTTSAGPVCHDMQSDPLHCGGCNQACPDASDVCENGACVSTTNCGPDPLRVCQDASGPFCCAEGEMCFDAACVACQSGTASWCVKEEACTGPGTTNTGEVCDFPTKPMIQCQVACEYWQAAYVCYGEGDFPGRATCCTPGIDCPACSSGTGVNDPGFEPCPTQMACAGAAPCLPPGD